MYILLRQSLLSAQSIRERETKKVGEEIMELLSKPTAKEQSLAQRFRSQGGKETCLEFAMFIILNKTIGFWVILSVFRWMLLVSVSSIV